MEDTLIIKLYRKEFSNDDIHDWVIDSYPKVLKDFRKYFEQKNTKLYFSCIYTNDLLQDSEDVLTFAEVEFTNNLSNKDKSIIIEYLKKLSIDSTFDYENVGRKRILTLNSYSCLEMVKFKKIENDEIIAIEKGAINLDKDKN